MRRREVLVGEDGDADTEDMQGIGGSSWSVEVERARTNPQLRKRLRAGEDAVSCGENDDGGPSPSYQRTNLRTMMTLVGNGRTREKCDSYSACACWS